MPKCYTFVCAMCRGLAMSSRADALTCSSACRVRAHRQPELLRSVRELAATMRIPPASILQSQAVIHLRPDLADKIRDGHLTLEAVQPEVRQALLELIAQHSSAAKAASSES